MFLDKYKSSLHNSNNSKLCIGLDIDVTTLPSLFKESINPIFDFNKFIIENTKDLCNAYKLNFAFYESWGIECFNIIENTLKLIPDEVIKIADAKRGDIGNTSKHYAESVFNKYNFDAITVAPYMGIDSIKPFFGFKDKCVFVLALTSNPGSDDFQRLVFGNEALYKIVIKKCLNAFGDNGDLGFVIGATHPDELAEVRELVGNNVPLLIPGVGAQGGSSTETIKANNNGVAFINVSRGITKIENQTEIESQIRLNTIEFSKNLI